MPVLQRLEVEYQEYAKNHAKEGHAIEMRVTPDGVFIEQWTTGDERKCVVSHKIGTTFNAAKDWLVKYKNKK